MPTLRVFTIKNRTVQILISSFASHYGFSEGIMQVIFQLLITINTCLSIVLRHAHHRTPAFAGQPVQYPGD